MANLGFFQMLKKKRELIPLIGFVSLAGVGAVLSSLYAFTKSDVIVNKKGNPEPWQHVDPTKPQKLVTINQEWKPIEELEKVRKVMK
ncbi:PREDICTED: normal mucosa of esophagus-specific gene 1 protein [Gekko japonicus]|uniref:Normal mucosa of esophagus-specific gene 1 protein n=1 Tax=Gekko japonicus TaxID=146911 RepID=A0ABM1LBT4_GEKJA|nr:PREDICTED: normal mucosa of esophagus-specific gene 1 protein [Gekko japonicus]XP_015283421.1 PREDICTED: normal mucosa of esophagus-specific gene 1 protein [Gekko japonicus]